MIAVLPRFVSAILAQQFEVASVKPAAPFSPMMTVGDGPRIMSGCNKPDPAMVRCTRASLKMLVQRAYDVKPYQIDGPAWLDSEYYDLSAKIPDGVPLDKVPAMLQALLAERFAMKIRKDTRSMQAYDLTVAKGELKMKEVETASLPAMPEPGSAMPPPPGRGNGPPSVSNMPVGTMMFAMGIDGSRTVRGNMTMDQLANMIANRLSRPVFNHTGLTATYEVELTYLDQNDGLGPPEPARANANTPVATLPQAVEQMLGLKLEAKKAPVQIIVVESANKIPTEN